MMDIKDDALVPQIMLQWETFQHELALFIFLFWKELAMVPKKDN